MSDLVIALRGVAELYERRCLAWEDKGKTGDSAALLMAGQAMALATFANDLANALEHAERQAA